MAVYRNISLTFWEDIKIVDDFTPEDKYFYLYLLTNPHTNILGCYQLSYKQMVSETGYNKDTIEKLIDRMENAHKVINFDKNTNEIHIKKWYKYNWTKSNKLLKCVEKLIPEIKSEDLKKEMKKKFEKYTVSIGYQYPMDTTVSVSVTDIITDTEYKNILSNNKLINIFNELLEYRKSKGLNNTKTIIGNLLEVLKPYNEEQKEKIIKKSLNKGYTELYPLKEEKGDNNGTEYCRI